MYYRITIQECVKHSSLPDWALLVRSEISMYFLHTSVNSDERNNFLATIKSHLKKNIAYTVRNSKETGKDIPMLINEEEHILEIYSRTAGRQYFEIKFEPTDRPPMTILGI